MRVASTVSTLPREGSTHYRHDPGNPLSLDDDHVYSIYEDRSGCSLGWHWERHQPAGSPDWHLRALQTRSGRSERIERFRFTHFSRIVAETSGLVLENAEPRLDRQNGQFGPFLSNGGLSLPRGSRGNLWIGSIVGLTRMDASGNLRKITSGSLKSGANRTDAGSRSTSSTRMPGDFCGSPPRAASSGSIQDRKATPAIRRARVCPTTWFNAYFPTRPAISG